MIFGHMEGHGMSADCARGSYAGVSKVQSKENLEKGRVDVAGAWLGHVQHFELTVSAQQSKLRTRGQ
jgi:hypothetical protein